MRSLLVRSRRPIGTSVLFAVLGLTSTMSPVGCSDRGSYRDVPKGVRVKNTPAAHEHGEYGPHAATWSSLGKKNFTPRWFWIPRLRT
jgi:hypothetical protein